MFETYYNRSQNLWVAYYTDSFGQLGDAQYGVSKEQAVFRLGIEVGRNPQDFTRTIDEYVEVAA
jgi:hypothetical protein